MKSTATHATTSNPKIIAPFHHVNQFKQKHVQGLYLFNHFEREDGAWFQQHISNSSRFILCMSPASPMEYYSSLEQVEARLRELVA